MSFQEQINEARSSSSSYTLELEKVKPISKELLEVNGNKIPITHTAFKDLLKIAGITNQMLIHLNDTINPNAGFALIKELTKAIGSRKNSKITLVIDKAEAKVSRIALNTGDSFGAPISADSIESLIKDLSSNDKINLTQTLITDNGTKVTFNLMYAVEIPLKIPGENISFGKQITWDMFSDLELVDMIERLVCTNGMTSIEPGSSPIKLNSSNDSTEFYNSIYNSMANPNNRAIDHYESKVLEAMQTNLSVYEFNKLKAYTVNHWRDDIDRIIRAIGDDKDWKIKYQNKGIDLEKINSSQLRNCPTPVNAWDAINLLTDLASHTYNTPVMAHIKKSTQKMAGKLLNSNWDENGWIDNLPIFSKRKI